MKKYSSIMDSASNWYDAALESLKPKSGEILVDFKQRPRAIPASIRNHINKELHALGTFHNEIPLQNMFDILENYNLYPIQEDGTLWSGLLIGGAECGSEKAQSQNAHFALAMQMPDKTYQIATTLLHLSWCVMHHTNRYEIVAYLG